MVQVESLEAMLQEAEFDIQLHGYTHGAPSRTRSAGHGSMKRTSATQSIHALYWLIGVKH
jgi:hypothetical protein